jgi:hypothetical protein
MFWINMYFFLGDRMFRLRLNKKAKLVQCVSLGPFAFL